MIQTATRVHQFKESVIRDMTRLAIEHDAINLSQGFPDFSLPEAVLATAVQAIQNGLNQYAITWGHPPLREKLAELYTQRLGWPVNADEHVTVTCGVTEGIVIAMGAVLNPGDEIIILEPAHDNFRPAAYMAGARPRPLPLNPPDYRLEYEQLKSLITPQTKALLLNTPHNPTGRVFDAGELRAVTDIVIQNDLVLITDEIYDRILYDGRQHVCPGSLPALQKRTITIGGLGKTYAVTGWRLGYVIAPAPLAKAIRALHDFSTICAPTPLQAAAVTALTLPQSYYDTNIQRYHKRRALMMQILADTGFAANQPEGAYYILADYSHIDRPQAQLNPTEFAKWMTSEVGVAVVPADSFYSVPGFGQTSIRFAFPKKLETLEAAGDRMRKAL